MALRLAKKDGVALITATVIRLAADVIWLSALFDLPIMSDEMNEKVLKYLFEISYGKKKVET